MTNEAVKENVCKKETWCRLLYMVLFGIVLYVVLMLLGLVVIVQLIYAFFTGSANADIRRFGSHMAHYINQIVLFLTYNDNRRPYPFNPLYEETDDEMDENDEAVDSHHNSVKQAGDTPTQQLDDDDEQSSR